MILRRALTRPATAAAFPLYCSQRRSSSNAFEGGDDAAHVVEEHVGQPMTNAAAPSHEQSAPLFHVPIFSPRVLGRDGELGQLWQGILAHRPIQVLIGADGVGKSTLASELCQQVQRSGRFSCVQWCDGSRETLASELATLAASMKGRQETNVLIAVDNVRDVGEVLPLLPSNPQLCVLVTTAQPRENVIQRLASHKQATIFTVGELSLPDAKEMLPEEIKEASEEVVEGCASVPLLLHLTSALLRMEGSHTLDNVLGHLRSEKGKVQGVRSVSRTVELLVEAALTSLETSFLRSRLVMRALASMDSVSEELLLSAVEEKTDFLNAILSSSLLTPQLEGSGYRMHELVQKALLSGVTAEDLKLAADLLQSQWPRRWRDVSPALGLSLVWSCRKVVALCRQLAVPLPDSLILAVDKACTYCAHVEQFHLQAAADLWLEVFYELQRRHSTPTAEMTRIGRECSRLLYLLKDDRAESVLAVTFQWCTVVHKSDSVECALVLSYWSLFLEANDKNIELLDGGVRSVMAALHSSDVVLSLEERRMLLESAFALLLRKGQILKEMEKEVPPSIWDRLEALEVDILKLTMKKS